MSLRTGGSECWCGGRSFSSIHQDYGQCADCGTLVYKRPYDRDLYNRVDDDDAGFYGSSYWHDRVPRELGLPTLEERARSDLSERAVFLLKRVLEYLPPTGPMLELGCAPGSLSYLLGQAGSEIEGIEMSRACIEFIERTFDLEVHPGPLEDSGLDRSFGAILAIDVLEHLPRPLATVTACADRLEDDGLLLLQTPCYRGEGPEWEMFLPGEHLFLYNEDSVRALLQTSGFRTIECRGSLFPYDMWVAASRKASIERRSNPLAGAPAATQALVACYDEAGDLRDHLTEVDRDRHAKDLVIGELDRSLQMESEAVAGRQDQIEQLSSDLEAARTDQKTKEELIQHLTAELESVRGDQNKKEELIQRLDAELHTIRIDRRTQDELNRRLEREIEDLKNRWPNRIHDWLRRVTGVRRQ